MQMLLKSLMHHLRCWVTNQHLLQKKKRAIRLAFFVSIESRLIDLSWRANGRVGTLRSIGVMNILLQSSGEYKE